MGDEGDLMNGRTLFVRFLIALSAIVIPMQSKPAFAFLPYLASETAVPVDRGKSRLDLSFDYEKVNQDQAVSRYALNFELSYGLINNLEFAVDVPYRFIKVEDAEDEDGLGDLTLRAKIRFIKGREANPVSIAGQLSVKFPSCDEDKDLSPECTGEADVGVRAIATKEFFPVTVHLNLGYLFIGNPPNTELDDVITYSLAFDWLTEAEYFRVAAELAGETNRNPGQSEDPLAVLLGLLYEVSADKVLTLAGSLGLTDASPDYTLSVGFRYLF